MKEGKKLLIWLIVFYGIIATALVLSGQWQTAIAYVFGGAIGLVVFGGLIIEVIDEGDEKQ